MGIRHHEQKAGHPSKLSGDSLLTQGDCNKELLVHGVNIKMHVM
jgi:hypothetical protein